MSRPNPLTRSLTFLHFLMWSATKRPDFHMFAIGIKSPVKVSFSYHEWSSEFWRMEICIRKPEFYSYIPWKAQDAYSSEFKVGLSFFEDGIPF